ncbi:PIN domain-containing protein [Sulfurimonas sp.]|uniref:PIN domain-containing protein n=1 Tax=Sulfurimonas sp. TaxID=2022749 RepID=UPI00261DE4B6|nr:PIN domain-containing protein [Sulfurimonas sp.]
MIRIDTNYIVRYLINDNIEMANTAEEILTKRNVFISNEVLAEVVYVLSGVYKISREDISSQLTELVSFENISTSNYKIIKKSLEIFKIKNIDFVDCILCAYSHIDEIITFDKKLNRCIENETDKNNR